jgi:Ca2+:H+ antiporter
MFTRSDKVVVGGGGALCVLAGVAHYAGWASVLAFLVAAGAICLLASLVGRSVEQLGDRFGPGATGVLQSALGNLPELFICIFSLRAGLVDVVRAALVGSILANLLLVLGLAFMVGGLKHGTQKLGSDRARTIVVLMLLSVTAWVIPSLAHFVHSPASEHEVTFSVIVSVVLLALFALSLPFSLRRDANDQDGEPPGHEEPRWPIGLAIGMLAVAGRPRRSSPTGSSWPWSHRWTPSASPRPSPGSWSWPSPATRWRTSSASSSQRPATRSTPSRSCSTARSRSHWSWHRCWCSSRRSSAWPRSPWC